MTDVANAQATAGGNAVVQVTDAAGQKSNATAVVTVDKSGNASVPNTAQPDGTFVTEVSTVMAAFAESFSGSAAAGAATLTALAAGNWTVARNIGSMSPQLTNSTLTVAMGTGSGDELLLVGKTDVTIPVNVSAVFLMSQRIANNEVRFGLLEVDSTGTIVPNANATNFPNNMVGALLNGATVTTAILESIADGSASASLPKQQTVTGQTTTASAAEYILECRPEDVVLASVGSDSSNARGSTIGRLSSVVPNPNKRYRPFLWFRNYNGAAGAVPASGTTVTINRILALDIQELQAEIGGGRGNTASSQVIPVYLQGTNAANTFTVIPTGSVNNNSNVQHKLISAATTNATSVKGSQGKILGGSLTNTTAAFKYFKFYNKASAPTVGSDTPILTIPLPPNFTIGLAEVFDTYGLSMTTGIAYAITGAAADADTTAVAAGDVVVNINYI